MDPVNQGNTGVVAVGETPTGDVVTENTLENLEVNIAAQLDSLADESTGDAETPAATPVPGETLAAADTEVEKTDAEVAAEETAKMHRVSQDNAKLRATLIALKIDPDSDTAEGLVSGLISVDDVRRAQAPASATAPTATEPATPEISLAQKISNLQTRIKQTGRNPNSTDYQKDMVDMMGVVTDLVQENQNITQTMESNDLSNLLNTTMTATKETFASEVKTVLPDDVREIGEQFFVGATDIAVGELARTHGKEAAFTANGYRHAAKGLAPKFDQLMTAVYKAGSDAATKAIKGGKPVPTGTTLVVNPIAPGVGAGTPAPPANPEQFSIKNLQKNVDDYWKTTTPQV